MWVAAATWAGRVRSVLRVRALRPRDAARYACVAAAASDSVTLTVLPSVDG